MACLKVKLDRGYSAIVLDIVSKADKSECQLWVFRFRPTCLTIVEYHVHPLNAPKYLQDFVHVPLEYFFTVINLVGDLRLK